MVPRLPGGFSFFCLTVSASENCGSDSCVWDPGKRVVVPNQPFWYLRRLTVVRKERFSGAMNPDLKSQEFVNHMMKQSVLASCAVFTAALCIGPPHTVDAGSSIQPA